uniref:CSD domain-containing protein n=1 Tax=viral metagenome TaxID=1070528 RepID=A0A6C0IU78_9ZZZZ
MSSNNVSLEKFLGRVKWFNNKAGYGFISITDGSKSGTDVFVHHSSISVDSEQYKYLVQGEYVEFELKAMENSSHEFQASGVKGIKGGKLMCETRRDVRNARQEYKGSNGPVTNGSLEPVKPILKPKSVRPPPNQKKEEGFQKVQKKRQPAGKKPALTKEAK